MTRKFEKLCLTMFTLVFLLQGCAPAPKVPQAQDADGFVQNAYGERVSWKGAVPVTLHTDSSVPAQFIPAAKAAAAVWNAAAGYTLVQVVEGVTNGLDRQNVISFSSTWDQTLLTQQAKTSVTWIGDQIQEADIKVNASTDSSGQPIFNFYYGTSAPNALNMEALLIHEMGHVLGLKHKDEGGSVMATVLPNDSDRIVLAPTDLTSLHMEY